MGLSERKKQILKAVMAENLKTGEPVGSKKLQEDYLPKVSSATIRNELAMLEELGFLYHPHTSAGRLPTTDGIKLYVDDIMNSLDGRNIKSVVKEFNTNLETIEKDLKLTAKAISDATGYTSIMSVTGICDIAVIRKVKFLKLDETTLVAILTDKGILKDVINVDLSQAELDMVGEHLTNIFANKTLSEIEFADIYIDEELSRYKFVFDMIINLVSNKQKETKQVAIEGKDKFFNSAQTFDYNVAKKAFGVFDNPEQLNPLLLDKDGEIEVTIASDEGENKNLVIVTTNFKSGDKTVGHAGVMGPITMDYKKVVEVLAGIKNLFINSFDNNKEKEGRRDEQK